MTGVTAEPRDLFKSSARRAALTRLERDREDATGRDWRGRFVPKWSGDGTCDRIGCDDAPETSRTRFCAVHRREHADRLLAQLEAIMGGAR